MTESTDRAATSQRAPRTVLAHVRDYGPVPLLEPLAYPGRWVTAAALLDGDVLRPLPGACPTAEPGRVPVLAIGSNGAPAQLSHKLRAGGTSRAVPLEPVRVAGLGVASSGHVSRAGYVAASPYLAPDATSCPLVTWLDEEQLALVDASEHPNYWRVFLPADAVRVARVDGSRLPGTGVYAYVNARGLLGRGDGTLRAAADQRALLTELLAESAALRVLCGGDGPDDWVRRARADSRFAATATEVFRDEGWLMPHEDFQRFRS